ncbi:Acid phosphatase [Giardia muris]|uniref:Acid phosphatase n=1 Tax=Giardia muris TaxID=5742 RepID=A0A4Z1T5L9_GIAMU|nr:Acid phosphatase [Giardia muris]|eukprot:TNJ27771.1 Acid phosphatase [Giardia muris]
MLLVLFLTSCLCELILERVQIVFRHGARTPFHDFPAETETWDCDVLEAIGYQYAVGPSVGQEATEPSVRILADYHHRTLRGDSCYPAELTQIGFMEHKKLGQDLREHYIARLGLLPQEYDEELVYVRSTDFQRTKYSALGFLHGLFGEDKRYRIHVAEKSMDVLLAPDCPAVTAIEKEILQRPENQKILVAHEDSRAHISRAGGYTTPVSWGMLADNFASRLAMGMKLLENHTLNDAYEAFQIRNFFYDRMYCISDPDLRTRYMRPRIGRLVKKLYEDLSERPERLLLYFAHDDTLAPLMGVYAGTEWDCSQPPFAATLGLELYVDQESGERFVRALYQREPFGMDFCPTMSISGLDFLCPLDAFVDGVLNYFPRDFEGECSG